MSADCGHIALASDFKVEAFAGAAVFQSLPHSVLSKRNRVIHVPALAGARHGRLLLARRGAGGAEIILVGKGYDDGHDAGTTPVRRQFCGNGYDGYDALYGRRPVPCCRGVVCGDDAVRRPGGVSGSGVAVQFFGSAHRPRTVFMTSSYLLFAREVKALVRLLAVVFVPDFAGGEQAPHGTGKIVAGEAGFLRRVIPREDGRGEGGAWRVAHS